MSAPDAPERAARQAPDAVDRRAVARVIAASVVVMAAALLIAHDLLARWRAPRAGPAPAPTAAPETIGILDQTSILDTRRGLDLRSRHRAELRSFGWIDRDAGLARVPIDDAIELFVAAPPPPDRPLVPERGRDRGGDRGEGR
ncbi:MAG: hypothetical protein KIS78_20685 [Labilithrix sp.]|nr:hypothetical protein [Labilithrix sp.]MCW5834834.1 hypothetical protein [Labilithrix sp.]